ncbi:hypothetical protein [Desulfosudis oleivorans]|uniref:hypothetical protein n=1 Tax=Desulfosudis oleivorans TaxID=181663 RepID=UPI0012948781|nr:hypothetical protein [Desulfosudis oleivorans]
MSIDSARIVCTGCDYETYEVYRPIRIRYQTTNGRAIETGCAKGWCYDCASYSDIERMNQGELHDELVSKERERLEARHHQDELNCGFLSNFRHRSEKRQLQYQLECLNEEIAELGGLLEIAKSRKPKARCLKCWSDRTALLTFDSESNIAYDFKHECGGNLQIIHDHSGPRINFRVSTYILNEEGEFLGEE